MNFGKIRINVKLSKPNTLGTTTGPYPTQTSQTTLRPKGAETLSTQTVTKTTEEPSTTSTQAVSTAGTPIIPVEAISSNKPVTTEVIYRTTTTGQVRHLKRNL